MKFLYLLTLIFISLFANANTIGVAVIVRGEASLMSNNKNSTIRTATKISEGDEIETKAKAYVKLVMNDRNIIVVTENSKMIFNEYKTDANKKMVKISLEYGSLRHRLEQKYSGKGEYYEVKTPTSVAAVRGTDFITGYNKNNGEVTLYTIEGEVNFDLIKNGLTEQATLIVAKDNFIRFRNFEILQDTLVAKSDSRTNNLAKTSEGVSKNFSPNPSAKTSDSAKVLKDTKPLLKSAASTKPTQKPTVMHSPTKMLEKILKLHTLD